MNQLSVKVIRQGLDFATRLRLIARNESPDGWIEHKMHKLATEIQMHYGTSERHKRLRVIAYLKSDEMGGSASRAEIYERFGWPMPSIRALLEALERDGVIEAFPANYQGRRGPRGKRYRLAKLETPIH